MHKIISRIKEGNLKLAVATIKQTQEASLRVAILNEIVTYQETQESSLDPSFLAELKAVVDTIEDAHFTLRGLCQIARLYQGTADEVIMQALFVEAIDLAHGISESPLRVSDLAYVAKIQLGMDLRTQAEDTMYQAVREADAFHPDEVSDYSSTSTAIADLAKVYASSGKMDDSLALLDRINDAYQRASVLSEIAADCMSAGHHDRALRVFDVAVEVAANFEDAYLSTIALQEIAEAQTSFEDGSAAKDTYVQAIDNAMRIEDSFLQTTALSCIAESQAETDMSAAEKTTAMIDDKDVRLSTLELIEKHGLEDKTIEI
jgi:tetratricopeptide (TPR) repeat protein